MDLSKEVGEAMETTHQLIGRKLISRPPVNPEGPTGNT